MPVKISLHPIKAILFDLDGTLVHSALDFKQIRKDINCPEDLDLLSYVDELPPVEKFKAEEIIRLHELNDAHAAEVIKGAPCLLERLEVLGLKTAIVTRNSQVATQIKIQRSGLKVQQILTREDAPAKPSPEGLLHFSRLWNLTPRDCIYVGDFLYDLQAANNAQMHACLYLQDSGPSLPDYANLADFICRDFDHFEKNLFQYLQSRQS